MGKPLALDLFCGGGGACLGMMQAGFEVVGVDIKPHKNYPGTFIQGDVFDLPIELMDFDFIWASPPCQRYSPSTNFQTAHMTEAEKEERYPDFIPSTQALLAGHPYSAIENVPNAAIRSCLRADVILTGRSMGLDRIDRKRIFETSFYMLYPEPILAPRADWERGYMCTITTSLSASSHFYPRKRAGLPGKVPVWEANAVMGIPDGFRLTGKEIGEAVPPPYARFIATEALRQITQQMNRIKSYPSKLKTSKEAMYARQSYLIS